MVEKEGSAIRAHQFIASTRFTARELVTLAFRQARLITLVFLAITAVGVLMATTLKAMYTAAARLLVLPSRDYVMRQYVSQVGGPRVALDQNQVVRTEIEIITSRSMAEKVIDTIGRERP